MLQLGELICILRVSTVSWRCDYCSLEVMIYARIILAVKKNTSFSFSTENITSITLKCVLQGHIPTALSCLWLLQAVHGGRLVESLSPSSRPPASSHPHVRNTRSCTSVRSFFLNPVPLLWLSRLLLHFLMFCCSPFSWWHGMQKSEFWHIWKSFYYVLFSSHWQIWELD